MRTNIAIYLNSNPTAEPCPICGKATNPNVGAELFLEGDDAIICRDCGFEHAPVLTGLVELGDAARRFAEAENDYGLMATSLETGDRLSNVHPFRVINGGLTQKITFGGTQ